MPYNKPDQTDPNVLIGVKLPATIETTREMAYVFAEEFVRLGFETKQILNLFKQPFYAGSHKAYRELGSVEIKKIVEECMAIWGRTESNLTNQVKKGA